MSEHLAAEIVDAFEKGQISRRQLIGRLMALGATAGAVTAGAAIPLAADERAAASAQPPDSDAPRADENREPTFQATGLHHIALNITDMDRTREFYSAHLGLDVIRGDRNALFMGHQGHFMLTLFRREEAGFHHYAFSIPDYNVHQAEERLVAAGLRPRRAGGRIYFPDPDGYIVQVSQQRG